MRLRTSWNRFAMTRLGSSESLQPPAVKLNDSTTSGGGSKPSHRTIIPSFSSNRACLRNLNRQLQLSEGNLKVSFKDFGRKRARELMKNQHHSFGGHKKQRRNLAFTATKQHIYRSSNCASEGRAPLFAVMHQCWWCKAKAGVTYCWVARSVDVTMALRSSLLATSPSSMFG